MLPLPKSSFKRFKIPLSRSICLLLVQHDLDKSTSFLFDKYGKELEVSAVKNDIFRKKVSVVEILELYNKYDLDYTLGANY